MNKLKKYWATLNYKTRSAVSLIVVVALLLVVSYGLAVWFLALTTNCNGLISAIAP